GTLNLQNGASVQAFGYTFTNTGSTAVTNDSALIADSIINSGSMTVDGSSFMESGGNYTQTAGFTQMDGTLVADEADIQGGILSGVGMIDGTLFNEGGT